MTQTQILPPQKCVAIVSTPCHFSVFSFPLTLLLSKLFSDLLPDPLLPPPLFLLLCHSCALLVEGPIHLCCLPWSEPVKCGEARDIVTFPCTKLFFSRSVRKEPASSDAPARPQTVLERRRGFNLFHKTPIKMYEYISDLFRASHLLS